MDIMCSCVVSLLEQRKQYRILCFVLQYPFEALFRSEQYALVDNTCREYLFLSEFFMVQGIEAQKLFSKILSKTLNLLVVSYHAFYWICLLDTLHVIQLSQMCK
jgi:hypothetical protein